MSAEKRAVTFVRSFIRWAGGKSRAAADLARLVAPRAEGRAYHEPFLGSGAVFLALPAGALPRAALLSDSNADLVALWRAARDCPEELLDLAGAMPCDAETYALVRSADPEALDPLDRAARALYLNRSGFNGLWRVNRDGRHNVPFDRSKAGRPIVDDALRARVLAASARLRACRAEIHRRDFRASLLDDIDAGDVVYCDPPYLGTFSSYSSTGFGESDHADLARALADLARRGAAWVLSGSAAMVPIYGALGRVSAAPARRSIAADPARRASQAEITIVNFPDEIRRLA